MPDTLTADLGAGAATSGTESPAINPTSDENFSFPSDFENLGDEIEILPEEGSNLPTPPGTQSGSGAEGGSPQSPSASSGTQTPPAPGQAQTPAAPTPGQSPAGQQAPGQAQPQTATGSQTAPTGTSTPRGPMGPGELAQALGKNRETIINALATQKFQLTPAEVSALEVDAVGVLPKIMGRVYYEATVNGLQQMANMVPRMVEHVVSERIAESQAEDAFHADWPNIDRTNPQQMTAVAQFAQSFRQMNPRATQADAIKFVGMAVSQMFNLPITQRVANGQTQTPAPARGTTPPARRTAPPFAPAQGGRAQPPAGTPTSPAEPFGGMGIDFDG